MPPVYPMTVTPLLPTTIAEAEERDHWINRLTAAHPLLIMKQAIIDAEVAAGFLSGPSYPIINPPGPEHTLAFQLFEDAVWEEAERIAELEPLLPGFKRAPFFRKRLARVLRVMWDRAEVKEGGPPRPPHSKARAAAELQAARIEGRRR